MSKLKKLLHRLRTRKQARAILGIVRLAITGRTALGKIGTTDSPFRVLASTILSARTKDKVTEKSATRLFSKFDNFASLAEADPREIAGMIKPVLYHNVKSRRLVEVSKTILERFSGKVPRTMEELLDLPGVGRKTANCVLVYGFGVPAIPVDVHVHRVSNRIGLVRTKNPEETERALSRIYNKKYWLDLNELFVRFGQTICRPLNPLCEQCPVQNYCNYFRFEFKLKKESR